MNRVSVGAGDASRRREEQHSFSWAMPEDIDAKYDTIYQELTMF
ncbi:MAG: hypothetical protein AAF483_13960 [Planctomycetota bacterium]